MIADWSVEVGPTSPSIDLPWAGWVDLRGADSTERIARALPEAQLYPELLDLLRLVNRGGLFSAKVDVFPVAREEADPEIAEAGEAATRFGLGSYLDLALDRVGDQLDPDRVSDRPGPHRPEPDCTEMAEFAPFEALSRVLVEKLRKIEMAQLCSAEIVVRPAHVFGRESFGWTVYALGFGASEASARQAWAAAAVAIYGEAGAVLGAWIALNGGVEAEAEPDDSAGAVSRTGAAVPEKAKTVFVGE